MKHRFLAKRYWNPITTPMGEVVNLASKYEDIIALSLGDPDLTTDARIIEAACADAKAGHTRYTELLGYAELRQEIIRYYQALYDYPLQLDEIMTVTGACHGMYLVLEAILDEGDEVIVPEPYFTPYAQQIRQARGKMVPVPALEENGFQVKAEDITKAVTQRTRAILINTPNNPTGACFSAETLHTIAAVAEAHDFMLIADDIYGAFSFETPFIPLTTLPRLRERTVTIGSFSKDYCMTGWRVGYVLAPEYLIRCIRDINEGLCFTAPAPSQRAAIHALRMRGEIQPPMIAEYKRRVFYAYERVLETPNMSVMAPQGTFYMFINIKETGLSSLEASRRILEEAHVLTVPGIAFGDSGEGYLRIACTVGVKQLKTAFDRIQRMPLFSRD